MQYYFCQLSTQQRLQIAAALASDLGSGRQAPGRLTAIPIAGCVIDRVFKEIMSVFFATVAIISLAKL